YQALFVLPKRIALLNSTARVSFGVIHDALWETTLLHLCRLTDTPVSFKHANLTVQRLPALVDAKIRTTTEALVTHSIALSDFAREWRNRWIAPSDLDLALDRPVAPLADANRRQVSEALTAVAEVLNHIEAHYRQSSTAFDRMVEPGNAVDLFHVRQAGLDAQAAQRRRFEERRPS